MIELLDPRKINPMYSALWRASGWSYMLDYNWTISQALEHGGVRILDVGCGGSKVGPYISQRLGGLYTGIDRKRGQDFATYEPVHAPDIIMWVSSLEHNSPEVMRDLYLRSMDMLADGGLFLATVTVAPETGWFGPSENTNLSLTDILSLFDEPELCGEYDDVHAAYRQDDSIGKRYQARYGHWNDDDPAFIIAGVRKVK